MIIEKIPGATRIIGAPTDYKLRTLHCEAMAIREVETSAGPMMVSHWKPTDAELAALMANGKIELWIAGVYHPVVCVAVEGVRD
jgi:hypothetical protein